MAAKPQPVAPKAGAPKKAPQPLPQTIFYTEKRGATPAPAPKREG